MTAPPETARWVGDPGRGGVLLLSAVLTDRGVWAFTYSVRPGVNVTLTVLPGPDMLPPDDLAYLEVIRGLADPARPAA